MDTKSDNYNLCASTDEPRFHFMTCGSVDDGKSTLIGRLLYDSQSLHSDHLSTLLSPQHREEQGDQNNPSHAKDVGFDLAGIVDGLSAEKEQGITIDIAYRYFSTKKRQFIIADCPGHELYTRNMATAASRAELAIILVDATKGLLTQTKRHSFIVSMLGIKNIVLAINKMDLVDWSQDVFDTICRAYNEQAKEYNFDRLYYIPMSALLGDNVIDTSPHTPWYKGSSLLEFLNYAPHINVQSNKPLRMPVQLIDRYSQKRGYKGRIVSGSLRRGDTIRIIPSNQKTTVEKIFLHTKEYDLAPTGLSVTCQLKDHCDVSRGDMLVLADDDTFQVADQFRARLLWMSQNESLTSRNYIFKSQSCETLASITNLKYKININNFEHLATTELQMNEIGVVNIHLSKEVGFDTYQNNSQTGHFILIDKTTHETVAMGLIDFALQRSHNIVWQDFTIDRIAREKIKQQKAKILWFTGLSGSGKSTIANIVEKELYKKNKHTMLLDGDNIRSGLNRDLGFTDGARVENIRRVGEVIKLMADAGLIVLASFISPFESERQFVKDLFSQGEFIEVHIHASLDIVKKRDPKGLYKKALAGKIKNFTGLDSVYEAPKNPDIFIDTAVMTAEEAAVSIIQYMESKNII